MGRLSSERRQSNIREKLEEARSSTGVATAASERLLDGSDAIKLVGRLKGMFPLVSRRIIGLNQPPS